MRPIAVLLLAFLGSCRGSEAEANRAQCTGGVPEACEKVCVAGQPTAADRCVATGESLLAMAGPSRDAGRRILEAACNRGEPKGCAVLGYAFASGVLREDHAKAAALYEKGCALATLDARDCCAELAKDLFWGRGVQKDRARARTLFKKLCADGYTLACEDLKTLEANAAKLGEE